MILLEPLSFQPVSGGPVIFLGGPITAAPHWQTEAFSLIRRLDPSMIVASPRRFFSVRNYRYKPTEALLSFHRQRAWERYYSDVASRQGCVLFWLPGPRESFEGLIYGATPRYELGLWSARWARDHNLGLSVGGDESFPTLRTLAYDLEKEMPSRTIHRSLEDTVREAVEIARRNYELWVRSDSPQVELESELVSISHEEHSLASAILARLPDNPMAHPETLRREALRILKIVPDLTSEKVEEVQDDEELEELEDAEELEELEAVEDSDVPPSPGVDSPAEGMRRGMRETGSWFLVGHRVEGPKYLAVGRSASYLPFLQRLMNELGAPVYQSEYMERPYPGDQEASLAFYLETAERIDINLEGIEPEELRAMTVDALRAEEIWPGLRLPHVTSWEINRLYRAPPDVPVFWHTGGSMNGREAFDILGANVPRERIVED